MRFTLFGLTITVVRNSQPGWTTQRSSLQHHVIVREALMEEDELTAAFKVDRHNLLMRAFTQLLDTHIRNTQLQAWQKIDNTNQVLAYVGGAELLEQLRDEIENRRAAALEALRRKIPVKSDE